MSSQERTVVSESLYGVSQAILEHFRRALEAELEQKAESMQKEFNDWAHKRTQELKDEIASGYTVELLYDQATPVVKVCFTKRLNSP